MTSLKKAGKYLIIYVDFDIDKTCRAIKFRKYYIHFLQTINVPFHFTGWDTFASNRRSWPESERCPTAANAVKVD